MWGFVADKVALRKVFSEFLGFPLAISFYRGSMLITWGWLVGGRGSETV
jgi:hypothetical protein